MKLQLVQVKKQNQVHLANLNDAKMLPLQIHNKLKPIQSQVAEGILILLLSNTECNLNCFSIYYEIKIHIRYIFLIITV